MFAGGSTSALRKVLLSVSLLRVSWGIGDRIIESSSVLPAFLIWGGVLVGEMCGAVFISGSVISS